MDGPLAWARRETGLVAVAVLALLLTLLALTPSHYARTAQLLGVPHAGPVLGEAQAIRSDEWAVSTPYYQIAVANDLGPVDQLSPYREPLKAFFALPSRDWSMAVKPDLWGFLVLPPAQAFALHYAALAALMVSGFAILLRQLGASRNYALALAAAAFLSQFVQVWWTSNAAVLAWLPWPAVVALWRGPWQARAPAMAFVVAAWFVGQLYPAFQISGALALAVLVAAFRPEALRPLRLAPVVAGAVAGLALAWAHYADLIPLMADTVYPGRRIADGGGVQPLQLLAHLFPSFTTARFEPLLGWGGNACEVGVVGSFLPLCALCFADHAALGRWLASHRAAVLVWLAGLALAGAWMFLPIPGRLVPPLALVPANRMLWGFGLMWLLGVGLIAGQVSWRLSALRLAAFALLVAAAWFVSKRLMAQPPLAFGRFDVVILAIGALLLLARAARPGLLPARRLAVLAALLTAAVTFGRFNPVQSAAPIFREADSPTVAALKAYARANPKGVAPAPGMYGATLTGAGVPALNHTLLRPDLDFFRRAFPDLPAERFNQAFNRYEHVVPAPVAAPAVPQPDLVFVPLEPFAIPLPAQALPSLPRRNAAPAGSLDAYEAGPGAAPGRQALTLTGWAPWPKVRPGQAIAVALEPPARIVSVRAVRLPRPDVVVALNDPALYAAGFLVRLEVEAPAPPPRAQIRLEALDGEGGALPIADPSPAAAPTPAPAP